MAYSVTYNKGISGNKRVNILDVTADAATADIETGLNYIEGFEVGIKSITTSFYMMQENQLKAGTTSNGYIGVTGLTSGDEFFLVCYGT